MSIKIESLIIRNFKRVRFAEIEFKQDGSTILGGENRQGKSTFLDAIKALLGGKKYLPSNIHNEESEGATALIRTKLSNGIEVERSGKNGALKVLVDGKKGNQSTLNEFLNEFALDISKFIRSTEKEKAELLIKHLGIAEKLEFLDEKIKKIFTQRSVANADTARKQKLAESITVYDEAPIERVEVVSLVAELQTKTKENDRLNDLTEERSRIREDGIKANKKIEELKAQIQEIEENKIDLLEKYNVIDSEIKEFVYHDLDGIQSKIENAESLNHMFDSNQKGIELKKEFEAVKKEAQDLSDSLDEARQQRKKLVEGIKLPLPGLSIEGESLTYNGQKWDCMSGAERLTVATAISRAFKPDCGFVLVDELEQMDWKTIEQFNTWAIEEGIQIIGAMVCDDDKAGENVIIIEDGRVKGE